MNTLELHGIWWLPEKPDVKIAGTLKYNPVDGATLCLIGSFNNLPVEPYDIDIILGYANAKVVTLYKCYTVKSSMSVGMLVTTLTTYGADYIFLGHHFEKEEDLIFETISVNYSHLTEWTGITGFKYNLKDKEHQNLYEYSVGYNSPKDITFKLRDFDLTITHSFKGTIGSLKRAEITQKTYLKITLKSSKNFHDIQKQYLYPIQNFLSLGIGRAIYPLEISATNSNCKIQREGGKVVPLGIDIFYKSRRDSEFTKTISHWDMLFHFSDINSNFEDYIKNWFAKAELLSPVYDLYFSTLYNPAMYLQQEFLSLVQAIESYHRRNFKGQYITKEKYNPILKKLQDAIPCDVPSTFRESLKSRMAYLYEYSLRKRLQEIMNSCGALLNPIIMDKSKVITDICNTRNFLTHYDESLKIKVKRNIELYKITKQLKFLIEICFLKELGISEDNIQKLVARNQQYKRMSKI